MFPTLIPSSSTILYFFSRTQVLMYSNALATLNYSLDQAATCRRWNPNTSTSRFVWALERRAGSFPLFRCKVTTCHLLPSAVLCVDLRWPFHAENLQRRLSPSGLACHDKSTSQQGQLAWIGTDQPCFTLKASDSFRCQLREATGGYALLSGNFAVFEHVVNIK